MFSFSHPAIDLASKMKSSPLIAGGSSSASSEDLFSPPMMEDLDTPMTEYPMGSPPRMPYRGEDIEIAFLRSEASIKKSSLFNDKFAATLDDLRARPIDRASLIEKLQSVTRSVREILDGGDQIGRAHV